MKSYSLAIIEEGNHFNNIKDLSKEEYEATLSLLNEIGNLELIYDSTLPMTHNMGMLTTFIKDIISKKIHPLAYRHVLVAQLQNVLCSFRGYIDSFAHTLSMNFGKDSALYVAFNQKKIEMYEHYFSYLFIEQIRNYTQHRDVPVHSINIDRAGVHLLLDREKLLEDKKIKKKEIIRENTGEYIDIMKHINIMFGCLLIIKDALFSLLLEQGIDLKAFYDFQQYVKDEESLVLLSTEPSTGGEMKFEINLFNFSKIKLIIDENKKIPR